MMFCDVLALRKMQQDKAAANPPKKKQHEENCYKVDGYKSNHYKKTLQQNHPICAQVFVDNQR